MCGKVKCPYCGSVHVVEIYNSSEDEFVRAILEDETPQDVKDRIDLEGIDPNSRALLRYRCEKCGAQF